MKSATSGTGLRSPGELLVILTACDGTDSGDSGDTAPVPTDTLSVAVSYLNGRTFREHQVTIEGATAATNDDWVAVLPHPVGESPLVEITDPAAERDDDALVRLAIDRDVREVAVLIVGDAEAIAAAASLDRAEWNREFGFVAIDVAGTGLVVSGSGDGPYYLANTTIPDSDETATTEWGRALFFDVPPGDVTFTVDNGLCEARNGNVAPSGGNAFTIPVVAGKVSTFYAACSTSP